MSDRSLDLDKKRWESGTVNTEAWRDSSHVRHGKITFISFVWEHSYSDLFQPRRKMFLCSQFDDKLNYTWYQWTNIEFIVLFFSLLFSCVLCSLRFDIPLGRAEDYMFVTTFANDHKVQYVWLYLTVWKEENTNSVFALPSQILIFIKISCIKLFVFILCFLLICSGDYSAGGRWWVPVPWTAQCWSLWDALLLKEKNEEKVEKRKSEKNAGEKKQEESDILRKYQPSGEKV